VFRGRPLGETVRSLNKYSNNFIAEQLTKLLGAEAYSAPGSWDKGVRALGAYLADQGIAVYGGVIADGSGLSARNRIAPATLIEVVRRASRRFESGPEFLASLPLGGLDGTLEDRMEEGDLAVRGKTGHLRRVSSLTGVLRDGERELAFAVLVNGARGNRLDVDAAIDRFVASLAAPETGALQGIAGD
jgi:D-alanyl-D-alanine carboxypeptidase/D-alanyl-D-alanine-endopeptidase (penicillin-binding protein 4)